MSTPVEIIPWDTPFLPAVQRRIVTLTHAKPANAVIIMPHQRPKRYLTECFRTDTALPRPLLLPRILTVGEMVSLWRAHAAAPAQRTAGTLDQVALLHQAVRDTAKADMADMSQRFAAMDMAQFLPWGMRLAALFEECFIQGVDAPDIPHAEAAPLGAALLNALGRIQTRYVHLLTMGDWTTAALDTRMAADAALGEISVPSALCPSPQRTVIIAGFGSLTWAENALLGRLWREGARVIIHSDPALAHSQGTAHFACADHARILRDWRTTCRLICPPTGQKPDMHFLAGYDVHSQLMEVERLLRDDTGHDSAPMPSTAIVIANTDLLLPVLHHMPDIPYNVSMGYPLEHAPVCRLLEAVLCMHESAPDAPQGQPLRFHWRAVRHCLHHPCLLALAPPDGALTLREALFCMEKHLREGLRFANPHHVADALIAEIDPSLHNVLRITLTTIVDTVAHAQTLYAMGEAIRCICELLLTYGASAIERSPLDAESLYRILRYVVPQLTGNALAWETLPQATLFAVTRETLRAERVPFEADPLTGVQVLGMLETRLLHFERVIIVDATDDALPGFSAQDPLLPDALRGTLGLPDVHSRERSSAYTVYRLLASATQAHMLWQEGIQRSSLFQDKKSRSRFVDDCLWRIEQERTHLIHHGTAPLRVAACPIVPPQRQRQGLTGSDVMRAALFRRCERGLSATLLDAYMRCPARFAWEHLLRLEPVQEVNEGDDALAVGALLHKVLCAAYTPWLGKTLRKGDISAEYLQAAFAAALAASPLSAELPPDSRLMLEVAAPLRLRRYIDAQPDSTHIHALETTLSAPLQGSPWPVYGVLDRVDKRSGGLIVLDYKTGKTPVPELSVWEDAALWQNLNAATAMFGDAAALSALALAIPSVQLPLYMYLCGHGGDVVQDAALVRLGDDGIEYPLLGESADDALRALLMQDRIPRLLAFLATHMANATDYPAHEGTQCSWCPYTHICRIPA